MVIYTYEINQTANNKVNFQKLYLESQATTVPVEKVTGVEGKIYVHCNAELTEQNKTDLTALITNHDGQDATAFSENAVKERELIIRGLNQTAIFHPILDTVKTIEYLTSIDNYVNAWIRSGINNVIIAKIMADKEAGEPFHDFLNAVVNERGNKTFEYFISKLQ